MTVVWNVNLDSMDSNRKDILLLEFWEYTLSEIRGCRGKDGLGEWGFDIID